MASNGTDANRGYLPPEMFLRIFSYLNNANDFKCLFNVCWAWRKLTGVIVSFNIHYLTRFGQNVRVVGSPEPLGNWAPDKALRLTWDEGWWTGELHVPAESSIEYKYFIGQTAKILDNPWEHGPNRHRKFGKETMGTRVDLIEHWKQAIKKIHTITTPHNSEIQCLKFSPYANSLVSLSGDNAVRVWNALDFSLRSTLPTTSSILYSLALAQDSSKLWTFGDKLCLWDLNKNIRTTTASLPCSSGGGILGLSSSTTKRLSLVSSDMLTTEGKPSVAASVVTAERDDLVVATCRNGTVTVYDARSMKQVHSVDCSGRVIASHVCGNKVILSSMHNGGTLHVVDFRMLGRPYDLVYADTPELLGYSHVQALASDPSGMPDRVFLGTGQYHSAPREGMRPNGGSIRVLDLRTMEVQPPKTNATPIAPYTADGPSPAHRGYGGTFSLAAGNGYLYSGGDVYAEAGTWEDRVRDVVQLWDSSNLFHIQVLEGGHTEGVGCLEVSDGYLYTGGKDGKIIVWKEGGR